MVNYVLSVKTARDAGVYLTQQTFQLGQFADGFTDGITPVQWASRLYR
jgi:hypothetical protein